MQFIQDVGGTVLGEGFVEVFYGIRNIALLVIRAACAAQRLRNKLVVCTNLAYMSVNHYEFTV